MGMEISVLQLSVLNWVAPKSALMALAIAGITDMIEPESWPTWLQIPIVILLALGAALAWFATGWGGLFVAAFGMLFAVYFRYRNSR
jgi:hypothetical protein